MTSSTTRLVAASALLLALGCSDSHSTVDSGVGSLDASTGDASAGDASTGDASTGDAGTLPMVDAGPGCSAEPFDFACDYFFPAETAFELPIFWGVLDYGCYCGETIGCAVNEQSDGSLDLQPSLCPGECDACFPSAEGSCSIPPLSEGEHEVRVEGATGFTITTHDPELSVLPAPRCHTLTAYDDFSGCGSVERTMNTTSLCGPSTIAAGTQIALELTNGCTSCDVSAGGCEVVVRDDVIELTPALQTSSCPGDCPAVCFEETVACVLPPLDAGEYTLHLTAEDFDLPQTISVGESTSDIDCWGLTR